MVRQRSHILLILLAVGLPGIAWSQADCSAEIAEIDRRIATGDYPANNVNTAEQMKTALRDMCGFMDATTRAAMMDSVEEVLPTKSEAERRAEQRQRSAELKAKREARKAAEAAQSRARAAKVSPVVLAPATARTIAATYLERGEVMYHTYAWDWDLYNGNLRLLYASVPDRTQLGLPDWSTNVYVAEMSPGGEVTHRHVASQHASDQEALVLRREADELFYLRRNDSRGQARTLERWSISERRKLSATDISSLEWRTGDLSLREAAYQVATSDGNLLFAGSSGGGYGNRHVRTAWFKISADARILGSGTYRSDDSAGLSGWFHTSNGGGGIAVLVSPVDNVDLASGLVLPEDEANFENVMTAHVTGEKRLLVVGADGRLAGDPIVVERQIMPQGSLPAARAADMSQRNRMMQREREWSDTLGERYAANRSTISRDIGLRRIEMVRETPRGYAVLVRVIADTSRTPPIHGPWIVEFDSAGNVINRIHLQQLAEDLDVQFEGFVPAPQGGYYVHAPKYRQIVLVDSNGDPVARSETPARGVEEDGIVADRKGVWVFGHEYRNRGKSLVYLQRILFVDD